MTWTIKQNRQLHIIELAFTGSTTGRDIREATSKAIALSKELGITEFLIDAALMEVFASAVDIYDLPANQYIEEEVDRGVRVALIQPNTPKDKYAAHFYETVCVNRGWCVQSFLSRDAAIEWL